MVIYQCLLCVGHGNLGIEYKIKKSKILLYFEKL